jgi:hypothetical protein
MPDSHLPTLRHALHWSVARAASFTADLSLLAWADGGQLTARRNAWAAMVADAGRSRDRAEAERSLAAATAMAATGMAMAARPMATTG